MVDTCGGTTTRSARLEGLEQTSRRLISMTLDAR